MQEVRARVRGAGSHLGPRADVRRVRKQRPRKAAADRRREHGAHPRNEPRESARAGQEGQQGQGRRAVRIRREALASSLMRPLIVAGLVLAATVAGVAQQKTTDAGVYTAAQAARGAALFESQCATCHREGGSGPNLVGERFMSLFSDGPLSTVFTSIKTTMPRMSPGSLSDAQYVDVVTHLLRLNGYPDGMSELAAADLEGIKIPGQSGSLDFALIQVVGCLAHTANRWTLSQAT